MSDIRRPFNGRQKNYFLQGRIIYIQIRGAPPALIKSNGFSDIAYDILYLVKVENLKKVLLVKVIKTPRRLR
jgi:hypothetical protein